MILNHLPDTIEQPNYDRSTLKPRVIHFGFGAFARAHQALVLHALHQQGKAKDWGYFAIYLNRDNQQNIAEFAKQDFLYSVMEKDHRSEKTTVCGVLLGALNRQTDGIAAIIERLAHPDTALISLTVTEKGYYLDAQGRLDTRHPSIIADLQNPTHPQTTIGVIYAGLAKRQQAGLPAVSVMSCDNIPNNGVACRNALLDYAANVDAEVAAWLRQHVTFPSTMVDRIVPAATSDSIAAVAKSLGGTSDKKSILCEPFLQWVIEDKFVGYRPDFDSYPGVQFVKDVTPYEMMKLRLLNGAHSFLAYLGYLAGYHTIAETMQNPHYRQAALNLMLTEQAKTLPAIEGINLNDYANSLITRFENPELQHQTEQIATDGSQKLPQRLLQSAQWLLNNHHSFSYIALGIAGWMAYVRGIDENNQTIHVSDPLADELQHIYRRSRHNEDYVSALLNLEEIFPAQLSQHDDFSQAITVAYSTLVTQGSKQAVANLIGA